MADIEVLRRNPYSRYTDDSETTTLGDPCVNGVNGGGATPPGDPTGAGILWEERQRSLKDIVQNGKYPCLVKAKCDDVGKYVSGGPGVGPGAGGQREVLHVLELRRHKMAVANKLQWDRRSGEYLPTGRQSEINVTQRGWFEVLPDNGQPVEYFDTINAIVAIRPKRFLVRTSVVGYQLGVDGSSQCWVHLEIRPGEILTTGIVHMDQKKAKKKTILKRIFSSKGSGKKEHDLKYLQCFDGENREIMIPLITSGVFSPVGDSSTPNFDAVYSLHDLISAFTLPIKAQLVHTDANAYDGVPSGVLQLECLRDAERVLVARHPYVEGESDTFEIPLLSELTVIKEKKKKVKKQSLVGNEPVNYDNEVDIDNNIQIDLPIRVKEKSKKGIFEKLSVRSKGRKERASLKALQAEGVFSSRLSKSEVNFYDTFNGNGESATKQEETDSSDTATTGKEKVNGYMTEKEAVDLENDYSISTKRATMQERDLPPVPVKTRSPRRIITSDKENHYEELPVAPKPPPNSRSAFWNRHSTGEEQEHVDDGYMTPARFRELNENQGTEDFDVIVKRKPPTAPRDSLRYTRARKVKSDYSTLPPTSFEDPSENIDSLFDFGETEGDGEGQGNVYDRRRQMYSQGKMVRDHSRDRGRTYFIDENRRFNDDSALESKSLSGFAKLKSRSQKSLNNVEMNATIRSHNVRKMKTAMEVFNFSDSMRDLRDREADTGDNGNTEPMYGRVIDNDRIKNFVYGQPSPYSGSRSGRQYVESEPGYRKYVRSSSIAALSDAFPKHGDDSAISCGEYGFQGESEFSYSEYSEWQDDGWIPPDDIEGLSVLEVSKSLRYIGMKDRVVIRFAREQIDGNMLCSLDKKLLKEGFPELNALDIKKVMDFIGGWRPKK